MRRLTAIDRERVLRTLTFWLRPDFILRVVNRFQKVAGFDRSIALASSALTAVIPLAILVSSVLPQIGGKDTADRIIDRYDLTGKGAQAVKDIFSPESGVSPSIGIFGALFTMIAVLSFTRGVQRLFEQTWELAPLSVRNTVNGLRWILGLAVYLVATGFVRRVIDTGKLELVATLVLAPLVVGFLVWSGYLLSARRIAWRDLVPFGVVGAAGLSLYAVGASIYVPHLFTAYADRYGVIGAIFAMISSLFALMVVIVGSASVGREVHDELGRIRSGIKPSDDEVQRQWENVIREARTRYAVARERLDEYRASRRGKDDPGA